MDNVIIFDSSTLISIAMNGLYNELRELKKIFPGKFIITKAVKYEIIDRPITIKRFELQATQLKNLLDEKVIETASTLGVDSKLVEEEAKELMDQANTIFYSKNKNIEIIHLGEASVIALSRMLTERKIKNVIAIDERTMRMLCEKPENLKELLERKMHSKISLRKKPGKILQGCHVIRSAELMHYAYKKGIIKLKGKMVLDAILYGLKFNGCSISETEIEEFKKL